jgi:hypothetical protein
LCSSLFDKNCATTVELQQLPRLITPTGFRDKVSKPKLYSGFSIKPFFKKLAGKQFFKDLQDSGGN